MGVIESLRKWVDGEDGEDALSRAAAEQAKPRRQAEQFIAQIARAIGEVMHNEAVPLPPDQTVIPPEYIVFLSDDDDRDWQGVKRKALEQGLYHVLAEHARDLAGRTKLATTSFSVELRVDGTLSRGEIRVQHSWEESSVNNKTSITPRRSASGQLKSQQQQQQTPSTPYQQPVQQQSGFVAPTPHQQQPAQVSPSQIAPTVIGNEVNTPPKPSGTFDDATRVTPRSGQEESTDNEATRVHKRELYRLEIWRGNVRQSVAPISKEEISIGRKSNKITSDIMLEADPEISRPHALIRRDSEGKYWLIHKGKNPTLVAGREIPAESPYPITPGEPIVICSYLLRIQP
jgi:hypothetical protein